MRNVNSVTEKFKNPDFPDQLWPKNFYGNNYGNSFFQLIGLSSVGAKNISLSKPSVKTGHKNLNFALEKIQIFFSPRITRR